MGVVQSGWSGPVPRMDGRHEGGGSRRPTRNSQLLQELHRIVLKCAFQGRRYIHGCRVGCAQAGSFSERWRGVEGLEGPSRLLRCPQHLIGRNPEDVDVVPSMKRYGWPFPEDTKKYVERFMVLAFGPFDRYNPHRQTAQASRCRCRCRHDACLVRSRPVGATRGMLGTCGPALPCTSFPAS